MPLASGFIVWLITVVTSSLVYRRVRSWSNQTRSAIALATMIAVVILLALTQVFTTIPAYLYSKPDVMSDSLFVPTDPPNQPMGYARGICPGRVVWDFSPGAANWDCSDSTYWWEDRFTDQMVVSTMLSQSIQKLTDTSNDDAAWDALFRYYSNTHEKGEIGYQTGGKIAIKLNFNFWHDSRESTNGTFASPQLVLALLRQLVYHAGVDDSLITFYDATRLINHAVVDRCRMEFPGVRFVDWSGGDGIELVSISSYTKVENEKSNRKVLPDHFNLRNYPNPFNPETVIQYELSEKGVVKLDIYNLLGHRIRKLVETEQDRDAYSIVWDGRDEQGMPAASGVYIYQLKFENNGGEIIQTAKRMVLIR